MKDYIDQTISTYNEIAEDYAKKLKLLPATNRHGRLSRLASFLPKKAKVLDIGCAGGRDSRVLADKGFSVRGIDLSQNLLNIAKKENPDVEFELMDMRDLSFPDSTFHGIWCSAALLHLFPDDAKKAADEMFRVLKKGGVLYLSVKEGHGEKVVSEELSSFQERTFYFFSVEEIKEILSSFETIDLRIGTLGDRDLTWIWVFAKKAGEESEHLPNNE